MKKVFTITVFVLVICVMSAILFACVPSNVEKAEEKMEKAGYTVMAYSKDAEGLVGGIIATKITSSITALYFDSKKSAEEFYADGSGITGKFAELDGKWVYFGDSEAIEAFTK